MNFDETFKGYGYVEFASAEAAEKVTFHVMLKNQLDIHTLTFVLLAVSFLICILISYRPFVN